MGPSAMNAEV
jgi:hypothetical protein